MAIPEPIYYECHITIESVFGEDLQRVEEIVSKNGFKLAKLLTQKSGTEKLERSNKDTFCTAHSKDYQELHRMMREVRHNLRIAGFKVWRSKIEAILFDEKEGPSFEKLDLPEATLDVDAGRPRPVLGELSAEAKAARAPLRPEELVEARHDRVHRDPGRTRAARTVRNSRRGTT